MYHIYTLLNIKILDIVISPPYLAPIAKDGIKCAQAHFNKLLTFVTNNDVGANISSKIIYVPISILLQGYLVH